QIGPPSANTIGAEFTIHVTNSGPGTYVGPIQFGESIPSGTTLDATGSGLSCTGGPTDFTCSTPPGMPVTINAGSGVDFHVKVTTPVVSGKAATCNITNAVAMIAPNGTTAKATAAALKIDKAIISACPTPPPP